MLRSRIVFVLALGCSTAPAPIDAGRDGGSDAGEIVRDAGRDAGSRDAGSDGGVDAGAMDAGCPPVSTTVAGSLGMGGASLTLDALCAAFEAALCEPACTPCGSAPVNCRVYAQLICDAGPASPEVADAIAAGDLIYDAAAAGVAIAAIADAAQDCAHQPTSIDLETLLTATGALHGALSEGSPCTDPWACATGLACTDGMCTPMPAAPCARFGLCREAPDRVSLACDGSPCTAYDASCTPLTGALGEACTNETEPCAEGRCAGALCRPWQCAGAWY